MARPRKPTAILELTGAFEHDPQRKAVRLNEPKPTGSLGEPPDYFTQELVAIWEELAGISAVGVLTNTDRWLVELACQLMLKFRTVGLIPQYGMTGAELSQLVSCLSRMGMTPADRSRVGVATKKEELDELAALAAECRVLKPN